MSCNPYLLLPSLLLCLSQAAMAQTTDTTDAAIQTRIEDNRVKLGSVLRPLRQVAGAPEAFYSYFWELGDGTYSFEKEPVHIYKDTGTYQVRLYATNNYDDGKKPRTIPRPVKVKTRTALAANTTAPFFAGESLLEMKANCKPLPGEDMVVLVGYRNKKYNTPISGAIMLLYNEKEFTQNSFDLADARGYHKERKIGMDSLFAFTAGAIFPDIAEQGHAPRGLWTAAAPYYEQTAQLQLMQALKQEMNTYRVHQLFRVNDVQQGEERFMFVQLNTMPEMIKDTNAMVTIRGLFIPDDLTVPMEKFDLELQIVASHDPNKMQLKKRRMNYRFTSKSKDIVYKVEFQNTGKGPARKVAVTITIPGMLNAGTIELADSKPYCSWCDSAYKGRSCIDTIVTKDSVQFVFNHIYLPGMQQEGVTNPDSTMGYIRYKLHFGKGMVKKPFVSRASIVFDKNEPIYTNRSVGRFKKGLSPGVIAGYGFLPGDKPEVGKQNFVLGATLSEFAPYRQYFQWELYLQQHSNYEQFLGRRDGGDTVINNRDYKLLYRERYNKVHVLSIEAVPLECRYNFSSFISAGAGVLVSGELSKTTTTFYRTQLVSPNQSPGEILEKEEAKNTATFATWRGALFADVQAGRVRTGPAAGFRFMQYTNPSHQLLLLYASWKF